MMIKLFITFSVHFLGYNLLHYNNSQKLYILIIRPHSGLLNLFILLYRYEIPLASVVQYSAEKNSSVLLYFSTPFIPIPLN